MRKLMYACIALGLGLSACKKEEAKSEDKSDEIELNGKIYSFSFLKGEMAKNLNVPLDSLIYIPSEKVFIVSYYPAATWSIYRLVD
ncbi:MULTISPECIES: hypothetical protein [Sphingobacterium]|uniref:hypothetical protein n=1 Tax=Sphingobacterium TaxID=28453 RepID=UPI0013DCB9FC|nr:MULTISPECIES: hypothetical protein [unclassified Sphingobacterium]